MFTSPDHKPPQLNKAAIRAAMEVVEAALKPGAISPSALQNYMARTGWRSEWQKVGEKTRLWMKDAPGGGLWVVVPLDTSLADYEALLIDALQEVSVSECRAPISIRLEVMLEGADE